MPSFSHSKGPEMRRVQVPRSHLSGVFPRLQVPSRPRRPTGLQVLIHNERCQRSPLEWSWKLMLLQPRLLLLGEEQGDHDDKGANDSQVRDEQGGPSARVGQNCVKAQICLYRVSLGRLLSKSAYKVDFLWDIWLLYKRFLLYTSCYATKHSATGPSTLVTWKISKYPRVYFLSSALIHWRFWMTRPRHSATRPSTHVMWKGDVLDAIHPFILAGTENWGLIRRLYFCNLLSFLDWFSREAKSSLLSYLKLGRRLTLILCCSTLCTVLIRLGNMVEQHRSMSTQPNFPSSWPPLYAGE